MDRTGDFCIIIFVFDIDLADKENTREKNVSFILLIQHNMLNGFQIIHSTQFFVTFCLRFFDVLCLDND